MEDRRLDQLWGIDRRRTTPGVQEYISYLCARLTFEEAAETFSRLLPLSLSARQAQSVESHKVVPIYFPASLTKSYRSSGERTQLVATPPTKMGGLIDRLARLARPKVPP